MKTILIDGQSLTIENVIEIAYGTPATVRVELSETAKQQVQKSAAAVQTLIAEGRIAYGITTGFGAFKDRLIPADQVELLQRNILVSHAVGTGNFFDIPTTRAIMLIRANTLARGFSGIRQSTLELLLEMLNRGVHPCIPEKGSLGASGDLAPLAHMSLPIIGEGWAFWNNEKILGKEAMANVGLSPISLVAKEGLALTNGTSVMCALGVLETVRAEQLSQLADIAGSMSLEALNGTQLAFDERIHALRPFPRQQDCARYLRQLLQGSELTRGYDPSNVQDAYTLRCIPQVHGSVRDAIAYARWAFEIELNAVTDNPLIFIEGDDITVLSGGNFHGEPLAIAMDYLGLAVTELGNISERRIMRLVDECSNTHTLPPFLTENGGLNSGFMIMQYTAAALATENKVLAHPASVDTIPTSANVEDHVSMGVTAALKARQIRDNVERIVSIELMSAAQGIDFRQRIYGVHKQMGQGTAPVYQQIRQYVPFIEQDTLLYPYIETVHELAISGRLTHLAQQAISA